MTLYPKLILDALKTVRYPGTGKDIVAMGMVEDDMRIEGNKVSFSLISRVPPIPSSSRLCGPARWLSTPMWVPKSK